MNESKSLDGIFDTNKTSELMREQINTNLNTLLTKESNEEYIQFVQQSVNQLIMYPRKNWAPHVNGWHYVNMVHGTWAHDLLDKTQKNTQDYKEFSPDAPILMARAIRQMGHLIKDIDPTQLNIEYETISGRVRNIQHATRVMGSSEFSITYKDNRELDNFRYHEFWYDYMEAYKKGFIPGDKNNDLYSKDPFIKIPYLNAVWIVIFKPFSFELQGLIKILGAVPTGLPIKEIIGQRSNPQVTTYSINYKAVDTIAVFYGDSKPSGAFFEDFIKDSKTFF